MWRSSGDGSAQDAPAVDAHISETTTPPSKEVNVFEIRGIGFSCFAGPSGVDPKSVGMLKGGFDRVKTFPVRGKICAALSASPPSTTARPRRTSYGVQIDPR